MSQQDSSSDGSITPSSTRSDDPPELFVKGPHCRYLGHLEAIPINLGGTLQRVFKACVGYIDTMWSVMTSNDHGPKYDICFKLPSPGNNWIGQTVVDSGAREELMRLIRANEPKGSQYKYHTYYSLHDGRKTTESFIFESYLEDEGRERVPEGPEMIPTLQERLGFDVCELV
ncbi:uncharacterized protein B0J16DRAFT_379745 [Fusarium flagelliforme]|uniref:Uncharacterized protein n=1 Tax=Fusarium flagelliforme TaxID=2675880 RepID=A0A395MCF8_9HYPO|nr:uncharacterized protein B0J16DRAFT_379745 [Fusarium flagelliforme]KAH7191857.1 hypothetical protein B0J16DRAFT_379745 [Fusarium flagelliforme]RFN45516.1 hypothetical protein FIE12Z_10279 [Fusarium flagelliforme]